MLMTIPMIGVPQGWELILIVLVILLLFGAAKLPQLARGTGQALRIFKAETKGLRDDDKAAEDKAADDRAADDAEDREPREITRGEHVSKSQSVDDPAKRAHDN